MLPRRCTVPLGALAWAGYVSSIAWASSIAACTASPPRPDAAPVTRAEARAPTPEPEPEPQTEAEAREAAEVDDWIRRYNAGEAFQTTDDPRVAFSGVPKLPCPAMPPQRPEGFEVALDHSDYEGLDDHYTGVSADVCHFEWGMLHIDPPPGRCTALPAPRLDALYEQLRELEVWTIQSKDVEHTPHTVGVSMVLRWPGARCEVTDVVGWRVVEDADDERWTRALQAVRATMR